MEVKDIIKEGRPVEPYCFETDNEVTWYKIGANDGYAYTLEEFENNRLKACDNQTPQEAWRETDKEHHRTPTFSDAIEVTRKQMVDKACKLLCDICYFDKNARCSKDFCEKCKAEGGDYWRFTKLAEE